MWTLPGSDLCPDETEPSPTHDVARPSVPWPLAFGPLAIRSFPACIGAVPQYINDACLWADRICSVNI